MGYKLNPFSLRYAMTLIAIDCPIVSGKMPTTPEQILTFLRVCSSNHPADAFKPPTLMDRVRTIRLETDHRYFQRTVVSIVKYMEVCNTCPEVYQKPSESGEKKKENVPGPLSLVIAMMGKLHMPSEEAWNLTLGQAIWYLTAHAVSEGADIKILATDDEAKAPLEHAALLKYQAEMRAKVKEQRKQKTK